MTSSPVFVLQDGRQAGRAAARQSRTVMQRILHQLTRGGHALSGTDDGEEGWEEAEEEGGGTAAGPGTRSQNRRVDRQLQQVLHGILHYMQCAACCGG